MMQKSLERPESREFKISKSRSFKIRSNSSIYPKKKKQTQKVAESFKNTTIVNHSLKKPRRPPQKGLLRIKDTTQKLHELLTAKTDFKDGYESKQQKLNKLKEEVKALPSVLKPNPNPRTYKMIMDQKRRRRMQHINEMHEFDKDIMDLKTFTDEKIQDLKQEVENYENHMNRTVENYMRNLNDQHLLNREIDILKEIDGFEKDMEERYKAKLDNIDKDLDSFEDEFFESIQDNVDNLQEALIDIAFKLEPEINELIQNIRNSFKDDIDKNKKSNKEYYDNTVKRINDKIEEVKRLCKEKKAQWKKIKHDNLMKEFKRDVLKEEFQNPQSRKDVLKKLQEYMKECYEERSNKMKLIDEMPPSELSKARIQSYLDGVRDLNDKAHDGYTVFTEQLIEVKGETLKNLRQYIDFIKSKVEHYDADLSPVTREELYEQDIEPEFQKVETNQKKIIENVIDFMEERDKIQHNVCVNLGLDVIKFGERMEKYIVDQTETEKKYEYEKAVIEDDDEEKLEELTKELDDFKKKLRRSVHHQELDKNLEKCFFYVDEIDKEFRDFHAKNQEVTKKHAPMIEEMFQKLENDFCNLMFLRSIEEKEQLEELADKMSRWKAKVATDKFLKEKEENEAKELEELIEKNKDNKKWKPPKIKPKNDKQKKQEWDELFEKYLEELKVNVVQLDDVGTGNARLIKKSVDAFVKELYKDCPEDLTEDEKELIRKEEEEKKRLKEEEQKRLEEEESKKKKKGGGGGGNKKKNEEEEIEEVIDPEDTKLHEMEHPNPNFENGEIIFDDEFKFQFEDMLELVKNFRQRIFEFLKRKLKETLHSAAISDKEFIEISLTLLDERIKNYYSMKGKIQTEIYLIRSGEITRHKRRYEVYIKKVLDEIDDQTERFNFFYQEIFDSKKNHTEEIKNLIKSLPEQQALTNLQGVNNKAKESDMKFEKLMFTIFFKMGRLSNEEPVSLQKQNENMLSSWKTIEHSGDYSEEEINWYRELMGDIDQKIDSHKEKRGKILEEVKQMCDKRKAKALEKFNDAYELAVDDLTVRDATGKVFGKPKREGQKIVRTEFAICQKTESYLKSVIDDFEHIVESGYIGSLSFRSKYMSFRECCFYYGNYLEAFHEESPLEEHPRVTYSENKFEVEITEDEIEDDEEKKIEELKPLQRLYYRGSEVKFNQKLDEVENAIKDETAKIYTGEYSKLLGPDKLTDVLREFTKSLKNEMMDFRIQAIRQLRIITDKFIEISPKLNEVLLNSIYKQDRGKLEQEGKNLTQVWEAFNDKSIDLREVHVQKLRPNLAHPDNAKELKKLNKTEDKRHISMLASIEKYKVENSNLFFTEANKYFIRILNNFSFLLQFYDNWILHEDYIMLPGDENVVKVHLNLKHLMIKEKRGQLTDTSSWRSIKKLWKMFELKMFSYGELEHTFDITDADPSKKPKGKIVKGKAGKIKKDKKGGNKGKKKKDKKGDKKDIVQEIDADPVDGMTPPLVSFKTVMQKSSFEFLEVNLMGFKKKFDEDLKKMEERCQELVKSELHFQFYWETTNRRLFNDSI